MFLGPKYMLAYMINLRKTFSPEKYDLKIINMRSYQNYFSLKGDLSLFHWKLFVLNRKSSESRKVSSIWIS